MAGSEGSSSRNSHKRSSLEKEDFVFDCKDEEGELTEEDALDSGEDVRFKPPSPKPPLIELRGREVIFAIATFFLFSVSIGLIVVLASNRQQLNNEAAQVSVNGANGKDHQAPDLCVSRECLRAAASIVQDMDQSVDPCSDFWTYSCGGWLSRHSIPSGYSSWSVDSDIRIDMDKKVREILESPVERKSRESAERKAKVMYRKCMDVDTVDGAGMEPILNIINSFGGWAIKDDWNIGQKSGLWNFQRFLQSLHFTYWVDVFFAVFVSADDKASHKNVIQMDQSRLGISFDRQEDDPVFEGYKNYMRDIARLFGANNNDVEHFANATFAFEKRLSEIRVPENAEERMDPGLMYNPLTVKELQRLSPRVNWLEFLRHNFSVVPDTVVLVTSKAYFANMSAFLQATDHRVLNYYMVWQLVLQYAKDLSKPFRKAAEKFDAILAGRHREKPRYKFCLGRVDDLLGHAVGALFVKDHFSTSNKDEIMQIISNIKLTFEKRLQKLQWMDEETKKEALKKLEKITYRIGYPKFLENMTLVDDYYKHLTIEEEGSYFDFRLEGANYQVSRMVDGLEGRDLDTHVWEMNPHELNAYFSFVENIMVFPAGILQSPFYRHGVPSYLNYGGIGATIGHELIHGFDTLGSNYDSEGNLRLWWSPSSWADFENRTSCLVEFYGHYSFEGVRVEGTQTQAENVADIGGLKQTFHAYKKYVKQRKEEAKLPGLDLSEEQMFFVAFGQNWCKKQTRENLLSNLRDSEHTPNQFRLSGTLSQMQEFADTFKCKGGAPMNPRNKCNIW